MTGEKHDAGNPGSFLSFTLKNPKCESQYFALIVVAALQSSTEPVHVCLKESLLAVSDCLLHPQKAAGICGLTGHPSNPKVVQTGWRRTSIL